MSRERRPSRRNEAGVVVPTRLVVASISMVALSGLAYVATQPDKEPPPPQQVTASPTPTPTPAPTVTPKPQPAVDRTKVYVVVFNNSNVKGLAGRTASKAQGIGWNVVGSDNWYGTIDSSTVYYPAELERAARVLAKDLGITRLKPAIDPMQFDRLTVILTGEL